MYSWYYLYNVIKNIYSTKELKNKAVLNLKTIVCIAMWLVLHDNDIFLYSIYHLYYIAILLNITIFVEIRVGVLQCCQLCFI